MNEYGGVPIKIYLLKKVTDQIWNIWTEKSFLDPLSWENSTTLPHVIQTQPRLLELLPSKMEFKSPSNRVFLK